RRRGKARGPPAAPRTPTRKITREGDSDVWPGPTLGLCEARRPCLMRLEPRAAPEIGLQPSPLASYNRPAAGVPVRLSRTPGHVRGPAGGPMLLNSRGPILLTIDTHMASLLRSGRSRPVTGVLRHQPGVR